MEYVAIVYNSNAGHTARYAKLLSEKTAVPCYTLDEAKTKLDKHAKVVFMGWLMAGIIKGRKQAARRYDIVFNVGVGMAPPSDSERMRLSKQNKLSVDDFQMLLGGYDIKLLHGMYRFMMQSMSNAMQKGLASKPDATDDEKLMFDMAVNGGDYVNADNLAPVLDALNK